MSHVGELRGEHTNYALLGRVLAEKRRMCDEGREAYPPELTPLPWSHRVLGKLAEWKSYLRTGGKVEA